MTDWKLGQYVHVWRGGSVGEHDAGGYEYGHVELIDGREAKRWIDFPLDAEVMLVGDDGKEIYARVKDLEAGE